MTVGSEICRKDYVGNGVLDTYAFTWKIYLKSDLEVYADGVLKTIDVHYTIPDDDVGDPTGGNVIFTVGNIPANTIPILIISSLPLTQLTDYIEVGKFPAETHEIALDRLVRICHQLTERLDRAILLPKTNTETGRRFYIGAGSPEGVITAVVGSFYINTSGGSSTTLYVKESGVGNTGWVGK